MRNPFFNRKPNKMLSIDKQRKACFPNNLKGGIHNFGHIFQTSLRDGNTVRIASGFLIGLIVLVLVAGCGQTPGMPLPYPSTPSLDPAANIPGPFTLEMLKNSEYSVQNGMTLVKLVDGQYEAGSGTDYISVRMLEQVAFGDLNSDGSQDAAVILMENYGGTGRFEYLVPVFNNSGSALPSSGIFLGDRVVVNSNDITNGRIKLGMMVQGPNDPLCCPSQSITQTFKFYWGPGLVQVHATSSTPAGDVREIVIENPLENGEVSVKIQLSGNVSISPFENTLGVRIMDANNIPIYQGSIMVSAPDFGAPGSFDGLVDLSGSPVSPGNYRIEVLDISMADGSILAMDSVDVVLK